MYKQQSYDTPTEEFFQPSEGRIRDDTPFTEKFFDEYLREHEFLDKYTIEKYNKSDYGKLYYKINAALVHTFQEIAKNKNIFSNAYTNQVEDKKELYTYGKKQDVEIVITKGCHIQKIKPKITNGQVNVCIHIPYENNDFRKYSLKYIHKYMGLKKYEDVDSKHVKFKDSTREYIIFSYDNGRSGQKIKRYLCIVIPFLEFIKFTDLNTGKKLIDISNVDEIKTKLANDYIKSYGITPEQICGCNKEEADQAAKDLTEAKNKAAEQLEAKQNELDKAQKQLEEAKNKAKEQLEEAKKQLEAKQKELTKTQKELTKTQKELEAKQKEPKTVRDDDNDEILNDAAAVVKENEELTKEINKLNLLIEKIITDDQKTKLTPEQKKLLDNGKKYMEEQKRENDKRRQMLQEEMKLKRARLQARIKKRNDKNGNTTT